MFVSAWAWRWMSRCSVSIIRVRFDRKIKRIPLTVWPGLTRFTRSSIGGALLSLLSSVVGILMSLFLRLYLRGVMSFK